MRKGFREAERLLLEMGFKIIDSGRSKHHYWILETPGGKRFKQPITHNTSEHRFWNNWKSQLRRHLNDDAEAVNPRSGQPPGAGCAGRTKINRPHLDAAQRKGDTQ